MQIDKINKTKKLRGKRIEESSQVNDRDPHESGDRIWVVRFERVLEGESDDSFSLLGHR